MSLHRRYRMIAIDLDGTLLSPTGEVTPRAKAAVHKNQRPFLASLTEEGRREALKERADRRIPAAVEFVCVLADADGKRETDGVVPCLSQWTPDLQEQRIPCFVLASTTHMSAMAEEPTARLLDEVIRFCVEHDVPVFKGRIDKTLFAAEWQAAAKGEAASPETT